MTAFMLDGKLRVCEGRPMVATPAFYAHLDLLKALVPQNRCVLLGSAALAIRGIRDVNDLDVLIAHDELQRLAAEGESMVVHRKGPVVLQMAAELRYFAAQSVLREADVYAQAESFEGWAIIKLDHLKAWKKAVGREKDLADLELLTTWEKRAAY